ncbi:hypothetical protein E2P81_ATG02256 [Venturia nashicola]|uniref:Uncharacterized protein n=1 Tax=Venturia nashicola TaxID=86259 RepID=A0A4Z1P8K0_9PEZI|nr:hypothetical protein E6O75_ATG02313 [Venturia nashicola]TLD35953.1 hypothetical protein E2P81_ATG02256 [Venturia nashicola]
MRTSIYALALALSVTPITASSCLLGLPDLLGLCPQTTIPKASPLVATTTPIPPPPQTTVDNSPTDQLPPPAPETTTPIVLQTTEPTRPAAIPTDSTPTVAPTVFLSTAAGNTKGPSTTLTVPVPTRDSTTTLLSVVVQTSATVVPSSVSAASVIAGTPSQAVISGSATGSTPAQVTANTAVVKEVGRVVILGALGVVGLLIEELYC